MIVEAKDLGFSYDNKQILNQFNYKFTSGEFTWIRGPSGCGKSTFLKLVAGLLPLQQGEVVLQNTVARIGYVHQDCHLIEHWTILENLRLVNNESALYTKWMRKFDLEMSENTLVKNLSGGEKQRLSLIRVILQNPDLVLLDEPTAHLDDDHTVQAMQHLQKQFANKTVLLVSHDQRIGKFVDKQLDWLKVIKK